MKTFPEFEIVEAIEHVRATTNDGTKKIKDLNSWKNLQKKIKND